MLVVELTDKSRESIIDGNPIAIAEFLPRSSVIDAKLAANEIDRHLIRPDTPGLALDPDGGLTIRVSARRPEDAPLGNWLPAPAGTFILALRVYLADDAVITGTWTPPTVTVRG